PCLNGGSCQPKSESFDDYYSCKCTDGWVGSRCQDDYDECTSSPCSWPYVCYNYENRYECACSQDEPDCDGLVASDAAYTCENYRRAESFDDYYSCKCTDGWVGSRCQDDYDECTSSPCSWPYVCYNYENRYECACS
ncbi:hypothetical protein LOTGIDRAFT_96390, partial [Lottia gigantea]